MRKFYYNLLFHYVLDILNEAIYTFLYVFISIPFLIILYILRFFYIKKLDVYIDYNNICFFKKGTDMLHRNDGPAVITLYPFKKEWWYNGEECNIHSTKEFNKLLKVRVLR